MFRQLYEEKYMRFPEGRAKALTFSYDDGVKADIKLLEIMKRYGLKGAFNLNSERFDCQCWHDRLDEEQTIATFRDSGQEIALHGARHIFMEKVPLPEAVREIARNREYLENAFGTIVTGLAYAYDSFNAAIKDALGMLGIAYARTTHSTHTFALPADRLELNPTCHHNDPALPDLTGQFVGSSPLDERKHRESRLFYVWGHSYEFDDNGNWHVIENLGKAVCGRKDIWFATGAEIMAYIRAYENLTFSLDGERVFNGAYQPVWLEIRGKTYRIAPGQTVAFDRN